MFSWLLFLQEVDSVPAMNESTAIICDRIDCSKDGEHENAILAEAIESAASTLGLDFDTVDADDIASSIAQRRSRVLGEEIGDGDVHDYVRHMLREAEHVCRYAIDRGSKYVIHSAVRCSDVCGHHRTSGSDYTDWRFCPDCHLKIPNSMSECDMCN